MILGQDKCVKAYEVLNDSQSADNRYKLALLCLKLNKLEEAESALLGRKCTQTRINSKDDKVLEKQIPNGAAGYYLLGLVHSK